MKMIEWVENKKIKKTKGEISGFDKESRVCQFKLQFYLNIFLISIFI